MPFDVWATVCFVSGHAAYVAMRPLRVKSKPLSALKVGLKCLRKRFWSAYISSDGMCNISRLGKCCGDL